MIYLNVSVADLQYPVWEIARLFYSQDDIVMSDTEPPDGFGGLFILGYLDYKDGKPAFKIKVQGEGIKQSSTIGLIGDYGAYGNAEALRTLKKSIKREIYLLLSKVTCRELPWGTLTGIRPAKIVHELLAEGKEEEDIKRVLQDFYLVSQEKIQLVYEVAQNELRILEGSARDRVGLYIGIPFCPSRCLYCSFTSNPADKYRNTIENYLLALKREILGAQKIIQEYGFKIESIYIGGGTPTSLDARQLGSLLEFISSTFDLTHIKEFTVEAGRPDSIDMDKLQVIKNSKASRISINPQTMNNETLRLIGRNHTAEDIIRAFNLARETGFDNINMDVIVGLPEENLGMFRHTMEEIRRLGPESLTVHTMAVKRASKLKAEKEKYRFDTETEAARMVDLAREYAEAMGMQPYYLYRQKNMIGNLENVGYCRPGFESVYNIQIMEEKQTIIALGAGAITKVVFHDENRLERAFNVKSVEEYISRIDEMIDRKRQILKL